MKRKRSVEYVSLPSMYISEKHIGTMASDRNIVQIAQIRQKKTEYIQIFRGYLRGYQKYFLCFIHIITDSYLSSCHSSLSANFNRLRVKT